MLNIPAKAEEGSSTYIKIENTGPDNNIIQVWVLNDFPEPKIENFRGKKYLSTFSLEHYDCINASTGYTLGIAYSHNMGRGRIVVIDGRELPKMTPIVPESTADYVFRLVCAHHEMPGNT